MATKKNWLGILVMVLVFGMMVVGCDDGSTDSNDIEMIIKITGINWGLDLGLYRRDVSVFIFDETGSYITNKSGSINDDNNTAIIDIGRIKKGSYGLYLLLGGITNDSKPIPDYGAASYHRYFTDGKTFAELGITQSPYANQNIRKILPTYNFTETEHTIDFSKFKAW